MNLQSNCWANFKIGAKPVNFRSQAVPGAETTLSGGVHLPPVLFKAWAGHPGMVEADLSALPQTLEWGEMGAGGGNGGNCTQFTKARLVWPRATESLSLTLFSLIWTPVWTGTGRVRRLYHPRLGSSSEINRRCTSYEQEIKVMSEP